MRGQLPQVWQPAHIALRHGLAEVVDIHEMRHAHLLRLLVQFAACPLSFAFDNAGNNMPTRMAMMAMTTNNRSGKSPGSSRLWLHL